MFKVKGALSGLINTMVLIFAPLAWVHLYKNDTGMALLIPGLIITLLAAINNVLVHYENS